MLKYSYPGPQSLPTREVSFRCHCGDGRSWIGTFECARDRRLEITRWDEAESILVLAANALYIIDFIHPEIFDGFTTTPPVKIGNLIFDENRARLFVSEGSRIRAYGIDRKMLWTSGPFEGVNAVIRKCVNGSLSIDIEDEEGHFKDIQVRADDGTIIRWPRFRRAGITQTLLRKSA
jgi:hypothetical protein